MNKVILTVVATLIISSNSFGQIGDIISELKAPKSNRSFSSRSDNYYGSQWIVLESIRLFGYGLYSLQSYVLSTRQEHPEIVSLEAFLQGGFYSKYNSILLTPQIRANWGAFSTEFRQQSIHDITGYLNTLDWQIVKLNIPIYPVILNGGMGFSHIEEVNQSFFEYTLGAQSRFLKNRLYTEAVYRSSRQDQLPFRQELKVTCDYQVENKQIGKRGSFRISPSAGLVYQNYYNRFNHFYLMAGVTIRYY